MEQINVLMIGSDMSVKGGMVTVIRNYLDYQDWGNVNITFIPTHVERSAAEKISCFRKGLRETKKLCKDGKADVVHMHMSERGSFFRKAQIIKICNRYGIPSIVHHHGAEFEVFYDGSPKWLKKYIRKMLAAASLNLVLSKRLTELIYRVSPQAKVDYLYNAVPAPEENAYSLQASNILFLGRLGQRKGTYDLLHAMKAIDSRLPEEIKLYLCGDGEIEETKKAVQELGLEHRVLKIGWIGKEEKAEILSDVCMNVLPSYHEGLPMTILETMANGIPNISTNIASIPEVITDGETGLLLEPGDVDTLGNAILRLVKDDSLRKKISRSSFALIKEQFDLACHIKKLKSYYNQVLQKKN